MYFPPVYYFCLQPYPFQAFTNIFEWSEGYLLLRLCCRDMMEESPDQPPPGENSLKFTTWEVGLISVFRSVGVRDPLLTDVLRIVDSAGRLSPRVSRHSVSLGSSWFT